MSLRSHLRDAPADADTASRRYKRLFMPEPYHIVQEIQKYNLPDYRPRMEQFQKVRVAFRTASRRH